jgi:hypothetical protein
LHLVYYKEEFTLVILIIGYKRAESLINILVYNFYLIVYFLIISNRWLKLNINNLIELILEARNELKSIVRNDRL